jgi:hypothetical protein
MKRKDFIRNTLLGFASLLLPEVLRPMAGEVEEEMVDIEVANYIVSYSHPNGGVIFSQKGTTTFQLPKRNVEFLENGIVSFKSKPKSQ